MTSAFNFLTSKKARGDALDQLHRAQRRQLNAGENAQVDVVIRKLKDDQQSALSAFRQDFGSRRQMVTMAAFWTAVRSTMCFPT